jgi:hypothetical protein
VQCGQLPRICEFAFREAWAFISFYFIAVNTKEAIMAGNMVMLTKAGTPALGGVSKNGRFSGIEGQESKKKGMYYGAKLA